MDGGTLQDFLKRSRDKHNYKNLHGESQTLTARDLTSFAYQIAKGMAYLSSKKVIHRDLAARNVLVDDATYACKVADFGFAKDVMANNIYERKSEGKLPHPVDGAGEPLRQLLHDQVGRLVVRCSYVGDRHIR